MTKWQLMNMLTLPMTAESVVIDSSGNSHIGIVKSIEREDGSGSCFNITMRVNTIGNTAAAINPIKTIFVRTID